MHCHSYLYRLLIQCTNSIYWEGMLLCTWFIYNLILECDNCLWNLIKLCVAVVLHISCNTCTHALNTPAPWVLHATCPLGVACHQGHMYILGLQYGHSCPDHTCPLRYHQAYMYVHTGIAIWPLMP